MFPAEVSRSDRVWTDALLKQCQQAVCGMRTRPCQPRQPGLPATLPSGAALNPGGGLASSPSWSGASPCCEAQQHCQDKEALSRLASRGLCECENMQVSPGQVLSPILPAAHQEVSAQLADMPEASLK